ncbi:flagellar basal-body rod protein FlgB [Alteromonadaceae bacterium Bs31]|nr:flagellar basal-body rod protein FlgB [Alteromonadaceae bacterium Bs31]
MVSHVGIASAYTHRRLILNGVFHMGISFDSALGVHESALRLRAHRAGMLASNLANADTPNYKAKDINFKKALAARIDDNSADLAMSSTRSGHINMNSAGVGFTEALYRVPNQPSIDGNSVEEQVEHAEFMKNNLEFQASFTFLNSKFKGLTKAIKGE